MRNKRLGRQRLMSCKKVVTMISEMHQQVAAEESRLAQKLYELGKMQALIFRGQDRKIWRQTPAGERGLYVLSRVATSPSVG